MTDKAIEVDGLGKRYQIGRVHDRHSTLRTAVANGVTASLDRIKSIVRGDQAPSSPQIWALRDLSFSVRRGEVVGIIGGNGAGKSTLLKILSRVTEPTLGRAVLRGRVGSLLEVGTGFHPELTGRDNIFLNGAILGMRHADVRSRFADIVAFAEVEKFIDTPVKHYSSGMYLRLAFAVAAHLEPDVLLLDEVLAVGDAAFQKKCLGQMSKVARSGRAIVFVSHNTTAIQGLCDRVIWLKDGRMHQEGPAREVVSAYLRTATSITASREWLDVELAPGNSLIRFRRMSVRPLNGTVSEPIDVRTPFLIELEYWNLAAHARIALAVKVVNEEGVVVFDLGPMGEPEILGVGLYRDVCRIPGDLMNNGFYVLELRVVKENEFVIYEDREAIAFEINDSPDLRGGWWGEWSGAVRPILEWTTEPVTERPIERVEDA